ncbi:MAG: hypothetical protein IJB79_03775 [Candidatus Gastranaerophilales bacterium]|nr:hypothetical protein [Candidatus Gastranaerophilales bacterium]
MKEIDAKVDQIHIKMLEGAKKAFEINDEIRKTIKKINKIVKLLANERLHQIKRIIMMIVDTIQIIILLRSLDLTKGAKKIDYNMLKKLAFAKIIQQALKKFLDFAHNLCAI